MNHRILIDPKYVSFSPILSYTLDNQAKLIEPRCIGTKGFCLEFTCSSGSIEEFLLTSQKIPNYAYSIE
ncbi:MAG: hypothetical protein WC438_01010 [Candidatus Pacearchaeota archaeon]